MDRVQWKYMQVGEIFNFYLKDRTRKTRVEEIIPKE